MENSHPADNAEENSQANAIFEIILEMKDAGLLAQRKLHLKNVAEELLEKYEMSSLEDAINLVNSRAGSVIKLMDEAQGTASSDWHRRAIYRQLKEATELEDIPPVGATPLRPRQNVDVSESGPESEEDEEDDARDWRRNSLCCRSCCCRSCWRWMNSATASTWFSVGSLMASVRSKIANESSRMPQYANGDRGRLNGWRMS